MTSPADQANPGVPTVAPTRPASVPVDDAGEPRPKVVALAQEYSGPIPPPSFLREYDQVLPGAADRILAMAERQSAHRHATEQRVLDAEITDAIAQRVETRRGQYLAWALCALIVVSGFLTGLFIHPAAGTIVSLSGLTGLASAFLRDRRNLSRRPEDEESAT